MRASYYCPNCGVAQYKDANINHTHVKSLMCSQACRDLWELAYARVILRKPAREMK